MVQRFGTSGLRFECSQCGRCCTARNGYGYVYLSRSDRAQLADHLGQRLSDFTRHYCSRSDGLWHLKHPERDCQFLANGACTVYEARPVQCRTWPFWPENMSARAWKGEVARECVGVGRGRVVPAPEIREQLAMMELASAEVARELARRLRRE